jgi:hypothetical protein
MKDIIKSKRINSSLENLFSRTSESRILFWIIGIGSVLWLLFRSGTNPRRLMYPCQRAAMLNSIAFLGYPISLLGTASLYERIRGKVIPSVVLFSGALFFISLVVYKGFASTPVPQKVNIVLPAWTSPNAVSDVFTVDSVPIPECSLAGGKLPTEPPCNSPSYALRDKGINELINLMDSHGTYLYKTTSRPQGIVGKTDIVVIKINNQWGGGGSQDGAGRLSTNTDVLKGLIWKILQHPQGFEGEIVVAENAQPTSTNNWSVIPANAEDQNQTYKDVVDVFQNLGYPVSLYDWTGLNNQRIDGGSIDDTGYPNGEYFHGNMSDAYILLDDPDGAAYGELSYPKFRTQNGSSVSMRYGIWDEDGYDPERLIFINLPVLKRHGMTGGTIAWKNLIGFITADGHSGNRFGGYNEMHNYFFGQAGGEAYGLVGRQMALIKTPDLNIVDAIWVAFEANWYGNAVRQDVLMASSDPFALDWYISEYLLRPITGTQGTSAARAGVFRNTTLVNQNTAQQFWPDDDGGYPYIVLLDGYDGSAPAEEERNQMNVYATDFFPTIKVYIPFLIFAKSGP